MRIGNFIEKNIVGIAAATLGAFGTLLGCRLHSYNQLTEYGPKSVEMSAQVFSKSPMAYSKTEQQVKNLGYKETYEKWKSVNDSLDWEQAKALYQQLPSNELKTSISTKLKSVTPQEAVSLLKRATDSIKISHGLNVIR